MVFFPVNQRGGYLKPGRCSSTEPTFEGLSGPAKAETAMTGSMGLLPGWWSSESLSEDSGDHRAPITGWELLSVARSRGM